MAVKRVRLVAEFTLEFGEDWEFESLEALEEAETENWKTLGGQNVVVRVTELTRWPTVGLSAE